MPAVAAARGRAKPHMAPKMIAPICPHVLGTASAIAAATTAIMTRGRSGVSVRAMPNTAWATTATAATFKP